MKVCQKVNQFAGILIKFKRTYTIDPKSIGAQSLAHGDLVEA